MYSMNWETCSFMSVRHVPLQGTLLGVALGGFVGWRGGGGPNYCKPQLFFRWLLDSFGLPWGC